MSDTTVAGTELTVPTAEWVEAVSAQYDEPVWLRDARLAALQQYNALSWPSGQEEAWRRTPLEGLPLESWRMAMAGGLPAVAAGLIGSERAGLVTHHDNGSERSASDPKQAGTRELTAQLTKRGVIFAPLSQAAREHESLLRTHLGSLVNPDLAAVGHARLVALSAALWTQGLFCYVPKDVAIDQPLYHLMTKTGEAAGLFTHTLIVAEADSQFTLVEVGASDPIPGANVEASLVQRTIEVVAGDGSRVDLMQLNRWGDDVVALASAGGKLGRGSQATWGSAVFGGRLHKEQVSFEIGSDGSHFDLLGVFVGTGSQHIEHITHQLHDTEGGSSELTIKGALDGDSRAVQYGTIHITPAGQRTAAQQTMRNLLLSDGASADPIPILEIEADDVKCAHAAAVGPVDPEQRFYLESRGIDPASAERLIVQGFLTAAVDRLPDAHTREVITDLVDRHLGGDA